MTTIDEALDLAEDGRARRYVKKAVIVDVQIATGKVHVPTLEGDVLCQPGDAIVSGVQGEKWPVPAQTFAARYQAVFPTRDGESGQYQACRNMVRALQITAPRTIRLADGRGSLTGNVGDWLVQYGVGDYAFVDNDIFAQTYQRIED